MKKSTLAFVLIALAATSTSLFATPPGVPDSGTSATLLTAGLGGLVWVSRFFRR